MSPDLNKSWKDQFLSNPPPLFGGVKLFADRENGKVRLRLKHEGAEADLLAAFLPVPYPSGLRRLLASDPHVKAVIVEHIPSGLDAAAAEAGVSYLDPHGYGRIQAPGFVYVVPRSGPGALPRSLGEDLPEERLDYRVPRHSQVSPFAPKASRVVRALLANPDRRWRLSEIAGEVEVDPGNAHRVLGSLLEMGLVERDEERYLVPDPGSLLETWAESARRPRERILFRFEEHPRGFLDDLMAENPGGYAVSGELAAELLAPYLDARHVLLHCLDSDAFQSLRPISEEVGRPVRAQSRIVAVPADARVADFGSVVDGLRLVSPAQIYVDLFRERGRAREAAEHLRREILGV